MTFEAFSTKAQVPFQTNMEGSEVATINGIGDMLVITDVTQALSIKKGCKTYIQDQYGVI
jgi:hypothetical protein